MKTTYKYLLTALAAVTLTACDSFLQKLTGEGGDNEEFLAEILKVPQEDMKVDTLMFSPDYKTITMTTYLLNDIGRYELRDSTRIRPEVVETTDGIQRARKATPRLVEIRNTEANHVFANDMRLLVLVDLTLPQKDIERIRYYVSEIRTVFNHDNLFVAFMDGKEVSASMKLTDYVLDHYFKKSERSFVYLYRSMIQKRKEMLQGADVWQGAKKLAMLTFSNEEIYDDDTDEPIDPDHYRYEEQMMKPDSVTDTNLAAFYASIRQVENVDDHESNVLGLFCTNNKGCYMDGFSWVSFKRSLFHSFNMHFPDNEFILVNPANKVYRGDRKKLTLNFYDKETDSLVASASTAFTLGSIYRPIIVDGHSILFVVLQGLFLAAFTLLLVWLLLQFIVPFISYLVFRHKYVVRYTGQQMSVGNRVVEEHCYICKAPFETGDEIVAKCEHTVHKSCWDENGCHCPEYSDRCKHGAHYYNSSNLLDSHNAPFITKWLLVAIVSSTLAWLCFTLYSHLGVDFVLNRYLHTPHSQIPAFGLAVGFFLTLGISLFAVRPYYDRHATEQILIRSLVAGIGCYLSFVAVNLLIVLFNIERLTFLVNWIPWLLSGFIIAHCSTFGTRFVHNRLLVIVTIAISFLSMHIWTIVFHMMELDYRSVLLFSFLIFGIGMTCCIASIAPHSDRFFLRVKGAVKGMDIALYKWFRNNPDRVVTIGKSVDCSLQLSWDIQSDIAPVHAEIRMSRNVAYLTALEPGVFIHGKSVKTHKRIRLFHGKTFTIGQTTFTYIEKDR